MSSTLVVVLSPAKAKTLSQILGRGFQVIATGGAVRDLPADSLGVKTKGDFDLEYQSAVDMADIVAKLRQAAKTADRVLLATDPDTEGEAAAWHLAHELRVPEKQIQRVLLPEITPEVVRRAIEHPEHLNQNRLNAHQARRVLDRLVSYQLAPLLWEKVRRGLTLGRLQAVVLRLIGDREQSIRRFKPKTSWVIETEGRGKKRQTFPMTLVEADGEPLMTAARMDAGARREKGKKPTRILATEKDAQALVGAMGKGALKVASVTHRTVERAPAPPFITATLLQEAMGRLRFTPKKTLMIAQRLHEGIDIGEDAPTGLITFHLTDSAHVPVPVVREARAIIADAWGEDHLPPKPPAARHRGGSVSEAIRPTRLDFDPAALEEHLTLDQRKLHALIWDRFLASQMAPAQIGETRVEIAGKKKHRFAAEGTVVETPGWLAAAGEDEEIGEPLPALAKGEEIKIKTIEVREHATTPPPRFTGATLIENLMARGVCRAAACVSMLSIIQDRDLIATEKGRFRPTESSQLLIELLVAHFPEIFDPKFATLIEQQIDEVEAGKADRFTLLTNFHDNLRRRLAEAQAHMRNLRKETVAADVSCERCGRPMMVKWGRKGRFLACSGYPGCRHTREYEGDDALDSERASRQEAIGQVCPLCGRNLMVKMGRRGRFAACPGYPECRHSEPMRTGVRCPAKGCPGHIVERQSKKGHPFYACDQYPACDQTFWEYPVDEPCPECKHPFLVQGRGALRGRQRCPRCPYKSPLELERADPVETDG